MSRQLRNYARYQLCEVPVRKYFLSRALKNAGTLNFVPTAQNLLVPLRFYEARARKRIINETLRENIFLQVLHKASGKVFRNYLCEK